MRKKQTLVDLLGNVIYVGSAGDSKIENRHEKFGQNTTEVVDGHPPKNCRWVNKKWEIYDVAVNQEKLQKLRQRRDEKLYIGDKLVQRHIEQTTLGVKPSLTHEQYVELLTARQNLRDLPKKYVDDGFPDLENYPELV